MVLQKMFGEEALKAKVSASKSRGMRLRAIANKKQMHIFTCNFTPQSQYDKF